MGQNPSSPSLNINNINLNNHHHHRQPSSSSPPHNHHDHQYNGTSPTADISEEELTTDSTSATTPTMTQSSLSSTLISRRRSSLPHKLKDNSSSTVGNEEEQEETKRLAKVFKSATHLNVDEDVGNYSLGKHLWDVDKASNSSCSDDSQHFQDSSQQQSKDTTVITADNDKKHLTIKSKRNNTLPLTITKENESPVHRSNTHPHLSSRNFQDQQKPVTYSNNSNTPNSATHKTSQKLIKLKPFSTPDLKRTALLNVRNQEDTNGVDLDILTPTVSDDASFNSSSVYSPPQHANSFRNSVLSTTSSASGGSSNVHNNGLIHSLFPSLPVDRSKMTDEEFGVYKEVISKPVYEKILKSKPLTAKCGFNEEYMKEFAFELSDEEELKNTYLTTDWVETAKLLQRTRSIDETTLNLDPSTLLEPIANSVSKRDSLSSIEEEVKKIVMEEQEVLKQDIKIKLIITEIANAPTKTLRQFLSPVLHKMNVLPEIGWFHSAILVGKWRLDFNDSSVVIPRKLVSQAAVITTDIETISTLEDLNRVIDGMSRCICKWNRSITYKQTGGDRINTGNCQDFVEDLLDSIGVKMNLSGSMKKFVKRLRKTGKCSLVFEMDKRFREYFGMESKRVKFKSHEQLDLFVRKLLDKCPNFAQEFNDEWTLLQSFDRTYWLKHITYTHIEEYKPYKVIRDNKGVPDCPFHEPEFTNLLKD